MESGVILETAKGDFDSVLHTQIAEVWPAKHFAVAPSLDVVDVFYPYSLVCNHDVLLSVCVFLSVSIVYYKGCFPVCQLFFLFPIAKKKNNVIFIFLVKVTVSLFKMPSLFFYFPCVFAEVIQFYCNNIVGSNYFNHFFISFLVSF